MIRNWFKVASAEGSGDARSLLRHWILPITVFCVALGIVGVLVAASGVIPIKASSGHWAITRWFLQFSKERSVATHTLGLKAPPLDDRSLILKGAGHYEIGCRPCHGSPELHHPRIAHSMEPVPPYLPDTVTRWKPEELFYMVKHGIKFTGMPAWPAQQRDDEVWAVVAFLLAFPELDAEEYQQLVKGASRTTQQHESLTALEPGTSTIVVESCAPCHGLGGNGRELAAFPRIAGQRAEYTAESLKAYARGDRHSGIMEPIAAGISSERIQQLAQYYEQQKPASPAAARDRTTSAIERGQTIAHEGIPDKDVPACVDCHGPGETPRNRNYPLLAGQYAEYLTLQLTLFQQHQRGGTAYSHLMLRVSAGLNQQQIDDVAQYYSSLSSPVAR